MADLRQQDGRIAYVGDDGAVKYFLSETASTDGGLDSYYASALIDQQYITDLLDSDFIKDRIIDSDYIANYAAATVDTTYVQNIINSTYIQNIVDTTYISGIVTSSYINSRVTLPTVTGSGIGGGVNTSPLSHPVGSFMIAKVRRSVVQTYNTGATYPGIFPGDTIAGSNLYYLSGITGSGYPAGIYNSVSLGSGTWKALAYVSDTTIEGVIRISGTLYDAAPAVLYQRVA